MIKQLTFDLPPEPRLTRADFCVTSANSLAVAALDTWHVWPNQKMLLIGPQGSGKSHLAQIWAAEAGGVLVPSTLLATADIAALTDCGCVAVDDADRLAGDPASEAALFHLHNVLARSGSLLITAQSAPRDWSLTLPDLASRMQATALTRLELPDDDLLSAVLAKLFADRQLAISSSLIPYLVVRMNRSIAAARSVVAALDARALSQHRPVSLAMAAEILESNASA